MSQHISMQELHNRMSKLGKNEIILDVREPDEYAEAHIHGSLNIPLAQVAEHALKLKKYDRVYIHCRAGRRAQTAMASLEQAGLTNLVCVSDGGMANWVEAGYEVETGN
ncbi:MAG: rhodanese-like domain-containing protein [Oligoflexia bacterium]|nr:rhodanese-like domain-containing protein [Oligoflexia bacterium]